MTPRAKSALRLVAATSCGLIGSMGLNVGICYFGGDHACGDLIWPAAMILGTGFEGGLLALAATILAITVGLGTGFWLAFGYFGPLKRKAHEAGD